MNTQQQLKEAYNKQAKHRDSVITDDWKTNEREGFYEYCNVKRRQAY
ncbi:hypothetical protein [Shouchella lehensis]|nr:hypothetical protein [Shouchella lehensis]